MIPPLDPVGLLVAAVSAAFFIGVIVHFIRSQGDRLEIPLTAVLTDDQDLLGRELFANVLLERRFSPVGPLASVGLHMVVLLGTPALSYVFPQSLDLDWRRYEVKTIQFSIPEPLLYSAPERSAEKKPGPRAVQRRSLARQAARIQPAAQPPAASGGAAAPSARRSSTPPRVVVAARRRPALQLPSSPQSRGRDVIIQPDLPPQITISVPVNQLPTAFIWAQQPAPMEPSRIVGSTPRVNLPTFSLPRAEPRVQRPNRELAIADLQIAPSPIVSERPPLLPVVPANVSPVRIAAPPIEAPGQLPATAIPGPNPTNLIALMENPAPPAPNYTVQAGNRLAEPQPASESSPEAAAASSGAAAQRAATPSATPSPGAAPSSAPSTNGPAPSGSSAGGAGPVAGTGTGQSPDGAGSSPAPAKPLATPSASPASSSAPQSAPSAQQQPSPPASNRGSQADLVAAASSSASTGAVSSPGSGAATSRTGNIGASRPPGAPAYPTGNLGIIIVQQTGQETGLEGSEVLTGQPVYTVYFEVPGSPRRWILEYCVPGSDGKTFSQPSEGVVHILPKRTVQPPYPIDRIPVNMQGYQGQTRRLVIFATVNERGETGNVRLIRGTGQDIDDTAVTTLRRWTFRPAMRGETPVAIEALFGIPLQ